MARKPKPKPKTKQAKANAKRGDHGPSSSSPKRGSSKSSWAKGSTRRKPAASGSDHDPSWEQKTPGRARPGSASREGGPGNAPKGTTGDPRIVQGRLLVNPAGFAFVDRGDGEPSVFVPPPERNGGMDGDQVIVSWTPGAR
ncbi:MAG: hypothetical protein KUG77_21800, partial [Nannocystaceae bacterium]|nr:hypothetical protein [Nannocystaceae bacterium]